MSNQENPRDIKAQYAVLIARMFIVSIKCLLVYGLFVELQLKEIIVALAGKETTASLFISIFGDVTIQVTVAYLVGIGGLLYGYIQSNLKKRAIKRLSPYQEKYELLINENRKSSEINFDGSTRKEDKL